MSSKQDHTDASEIQRILRLRELLDLDLDNYLEDGYEAVALHASSIVIAANPACSALFGYTTEEVIGLNAWTLFTTSSFDTLIQRLGAKSEEPYRVQGVRKDGSTFEVELKGRDFTVARENIRAVLLRPTS